MAHFALVRDGVVERVHVVVNDVILDDEGVEQEALGVQFLADLHGYQPEELVQCSYNATFRGLYPGPSFTYDAQRDIFIPPAPFNSWVLNDLTWEAPVAYPTDGELYTWDEDAGDWVAAENPGE
jgi:hypothetical protein